MFENAADGAIIDVIEMGPEFKFGMLKHKQSPILRNETSTCNAPFKLSSLAKDHTPVDRPTLEVYS